MLKAMEQMVTWQFCNNKYKTKLSLVLIVFNWLYYDPVAEAFASFSYIKLWLTFHRTMRKFCLSCRLMANHLNTLSKCKSNSCVSCNDKSKINYYIYHLFLTVLSTCFFWTSKPLLTPDVFFPSTDWSSLSIHDLFFLNTFLSVFLICKWRPSIDLYVTK